MLVINEDLLKNKKRVYSFITKNRSCIHGNIKMQTSFKNILLKYMNKLTTASYTLQGEQQKVAIKLLAKFKSYIEMCNENIQNLKEILEVTTVNNIAKNDLKIYTKIDNTYIRLMPKVLSNTSEIQNFLSSISKYIEFNLANAIDEDELGGQFKSQSKRYEEDDDDDISNSFMNKISKILS